MVNTSDSESDNPGSNPGRSMCIYIYAVIYYIYTSIYIYALVAQLDNAFPS